MTLHFTTNNHRRDVVEAWELPASAREEFDYLDWDALERGEDSRSFVRYAGQWIDLGDVMRAEGEIRAAGWDGFNSDSFFSGLAFRYVEECERVIVARVYV